MRKAEWVRSSSGPDVMDVSACAAAIQSLHKVDVSLLMSPDGDFGEGGLSVVAVAVARETTSLGRPRSVSRKRHYPSNDAATLEGLLFRLLHELDNDCGSMWQQESLPGA